MARALSTLEDRLRSARFARNWSLLVISNLAGQTLGMVASVRIARELAPLGYGQYNLVLAMAGLGAVVGGLGLRNVIIRECARSPEHAAQIFFASAIIRSAALLVAVTGIVLYGQVSHRDLPVGLDAIAAALLVGQSAWDLVESVAFAREQMEYSAGINLGGSALWVATVWAVPRMWLTPFTVSLAFAALQAGKTLAYAAAGARANYFRGGLAVTDWWGIVRTLFVQSLPFYWLSILTAATSLLPLIFLSERSGQAELGLYNVGFRLVNPMQMFMLTALTALYPGLSQSGVNDSRRFMVTLQRALLGITVIGTTGALVISVLRNELVVLLFGAPYRQAADTMAFLCWYTVLQAIYSLIGTTLAARDKQRKLAALATCYAVTAFPLLWLGAGNGSSGLAAAGLVAAVLNMGYHWVVFQRSLPEAIPMRSALLSMTVLVGGMATSWIIPQELPLLWRTTVVGLISLLTVATAWEMLQSHSSVRTEKVPTRSATAD